MREVVIASSVRTAVGKAPRGALRNTRPDDLAAVAIRGALERLPQVFRRRRRWIWPVLFGTNRYH